MPYKNNKRPSTQNKNVHPVSDITDNVKWENELSHSRELSDDYQNEMVDYRYVRNDLEDKSLEAAGSDQACVSCGDKKDDTHS